MVSRLGGDEFVVVMSAIHQAEDGDTLKRYADAAMYEVKLSGKNHYRFHGRPA